MALFKKPLKCLFLVIFCSSIYYAQFTFLLNVILIADNFNTSYQRKWCSVGCYVTLTNALCVADQDMIKYKNKESKAQCTGTKIRCNYLYSRVFDFDLNTPAGSLH